MGYVYLQHHGILGQKWGVRRFQNADGSYTAAGKKRYGDGENNGRVTVRQANKIAFEARKDSFSKDRVKSKAGEKVTIRQANNNARKAANMAVKAVKKSKPVIEDHTGIKNHVDKKEFRERRRDVSKSRTFGAKLTTNLLAGPFANRTYNSVIAAGGSKEGAVGMTAVATILGGPVGHIVVSAVYTNNASEKTYRK